MWFPQGRSAIVSRVQWLQGHTYVGQYLGRILHQKLFYLRWISLLQVSLLSFTSLLTNIACIVHMNCALCILHQTCANSMHLPINGILLFSSRFTMNGSPVQNTAMASKKVEWGATISTGASDCETCLKREIQKVLKPGGQT